MPHDLAAYLRERDAALQGTLAEFMTWAKGTFPYGISISDDVLEVTYHKGRTAVTSLPIEMRSLSKQWLSERNYRSLDDGDVPQHQSGER